MQWVFLHALLEVCIQKQEVVIEIIEWKLKTKLAIGTIFEGD